MILRGMLFCAAAALCAQQAGPAAAPEGQPAPSAPDAYKIETGTKIPLSLMNAVSTRTAAEGDRVYLETIFPILAEGRIVIPPGSYVAGTVTQVRRAGRVKGRAEMFIRFDSLTLPNGVTRDFRARIGTLDGSNRSTADREEGKIKGDSDKGHDALVVGESGMAGATVGALAARSGMGAGIGAAAGAAAGMIGVLATRGPDAVLERGSTLEMVLDRDLKFAPAELDFSSVSPGRRTVVEPVKQVTPQGRARLPGLCWPW